MKNFEKQRTKDTFMKKRIYKNWVMILAEMCLEWVKRKGQPGGDGEESRTQLKERALGGISRGRKKAHAFKNVSAYLILQ